MNTRALCLVVLAGAVSACDSPGGPDGNTSPSPFTVTILGPASVAPGQSGSYTVDVRSSTGSTPTVTAVTWSSNKPLLLRVDQKGVATAAVLHGDAMLQVEVRVMGRSDGVRGSREILVQADGTFRIVGTVREAGPNGPALHGARLEARLSDDAFAPVVTYATTTPDGAYRLYGVPQDAFITVTFEGYRPTTTRVHLSTHETRNFGLELETPRLSFSGVYTMTVEASDDCSGAFPNDLKRRTYAATLTQGGPLLNVALSESTFANVGGRVANRFVATTTASSIQVKLPWYYAGGFYYGTSTPDVAELLPNGTVLVISGTGSLPGTQQEVSGTISGDVSLYRSDLGAVIGGCFRPRVTLTRR